MSIEQQNESLKERVMAVEHEKFMLEQKIMKLTAQMDAFRRGEVFPQELSPPPESDLQHERYIKQELEDYSYSIPTPQLSFGAPSTSFPSPSTADFSESSTPATMALGIDALTATSDMTQHPAAMLCDLPCQSEVRSQASVSTQPTIHHPQAATSPYSTASWAMLISEIYSQLIHPLATIFLSLKTGSALPLSTTANTPMALPLIRWLISTPTNLLPRPSQTKPTIPTIPSNNTKKTLPASPTSPPPRTSSTILRPRLLQRLLLSSPALARPLRAATGRALRPKTGSRTGSAGVNTEEVIRRARRSGKAGTGKFRSEGSVSRSRSRDSRSNCITIGPREGDRSDLRRRLGHQNFGLAG